MPSASISIINRFHHVITNVSSYFGGNFVRTVDPGFNSFYLIQHLNFENNQDGFGLILINNYIFPTIRECSKTYLKNFTGFYSYTTVRFGVPNIYDGETSFYVSFEGFSEDENIIKRLFDRLPNFFASFEEEAPED